MPATIYSTPAEVPDPDWADYEVDGKFNYEAMRTRDAQYMADLRAWLKSHGYAGELAGELVAWGYADGRAQYVVMSLRPLRLMHLTLMDGYRMDEIFERGLRAQDIRDQVAFQRKRHELFARKDS